jgi:transcriptional regulator with XRE-family HTH domain
MGNDEVRRRRTALGWTQRRLADALGVTSTTVARWEQGIHLIPPPAARYLALLGATYGIRPARKRAARRDA